MPQNNSVARMPAVLQIAWGNLLRICHRSGWKLLQQPAHWFIRSRLDQSLWLFLLASVWLLTTPYSGIWHDGNLYALQALHHINPYNYAKELFFEYGSQDDFTLFSLPYAFLIRHFGLWAASLMLFCLCQILWLGGVIRLFRLLLPEVSAYICVLFLAVTRHHYGGFSVFSYAEGFLTARLPAEAIALWALSLVAERRHIAATITACSSILIHPLIGIWALLPALLHSVRKCHGLCALLTGAGLLTGLILSGIGPQSLVARFDAAWLWLLHDGQLPYLFIDTWSTKNIQQTLFSVIAITLAAFLGPARRRAFWQTLLLLAIPAFALAYILGSLAHNVLATQLQPWRILWVVQSLQWAALASSLPMHRRYLLPGLLAAALILSYLSGSQTDSSWPGYGLLAVFGSLPFFFRRKQLHSVPAKLLRCRHLRLAGIGIGTLLLIILAWRWLGRIHVYLFDTSVIKGLVFFNILPPTLAIGLLCCRFLGQRGFRLLLLGTGVLCMELGFLFGDGRRPLELREMACANTPQCANQAARLIPQGTLVYWEDEDGFSGAQSSWFYANTATYLSGFQSSSRAFGRQLALEDERRRRLINDLPPRLDRPLTQEHPFHMDAGFAQADQHDTKKPLNQMGIVRLCHDPKLDEIVANTRYPQFHPAQINVFQAQYVYTCSVVRNAG
jgi:hypothetical protein